MMMDLPDLVRKHGLEISGVLHVGARLGEEAEDYRKAGVDNVWWVEANPAVLPKLRAHVEPLGHKVIEALVYSEDGVEREFHVTNYEGLSSSLLRFGSHQTFAPDIVFERHLQLRTRTIDSLVEEHGITGCSLICLDLQGSELEALRGAPAFLAQADTVLSEVNDADVYVGCAKVWELDALLAGFERVETYWVGDQHWGDALWCRR